VTEPDPEISKMEHFEIGSQISFYFGGEVYENERGMSMVLFLNSYLFTIDHGSIFIEGMLVQNEKTGSETGRFLKT
jgi:hypothetical protein